MEMAEKIFAINSVRKKSTAVLKTNTVTACSHCQTVPARGTPALKACSLCGVAKYFSREWQVADWKADHKRSCRGAGAR